MGFRRNKILYNSSAAGIGEWVSLDSRYEIDPTRVIHAVLAAGDVITIQGTTVDIRGPENPLDSITDYDIVDITEFDESGTGTLIGPYTYIRAVKTGTAGRAKVQGFM